MQWWVDVSGPLATIMGPIATSKANRNFSERAAAEAKQKQKKD